MQVALTSEFFYRLLDPDYIFFGGSHPNQGSCILEQFVERSVWEGYELEFVQHNRTDRMKPGHVLIIKQCQGAGNPLRLKAAGIIMGKPTLVPGTMVDKYNVSVPVLWVLPKLTTNPIPFAGMGSTIHDKPVCGVDQVVRSIADNAKAKFLKTFCQSVVDMSVRF